MMSGENNNRTTTKTNVVPPSCNAKRGFLQHKKVVFRKALLYKQLRNIAFLIFCSHCLHCNFIMYIHRNPRFSTFTP